MTVVPRLRIVLLGVALAAAVLVAPGASAAEPSQPPEIAGRPDIVGGDEVHPPGKYPFMVALVARGADSYHGQFCGGSLIASEWVLTAAHCVIGERAGGVTGAARIIMSLPIISFIVPRRGLGIGGVTFFFLPYIIFSPSWLIS